MIRRKRLQDQAPRDEKAWQNSIMVIKNIGKEGAYWL